MMIQLWGLEGEHRTACCSIVCVPKQCVYGSSAYRESLCVDVGGFFAVFLVEAVDRRDTAEYVDW